MNDLEEWLLLLTKISSLPPEFWVINTPLLRKVWDFFIVCKHIFHRFDDSGTSYIILISNLPKEVIFKPKYFLVPHTFLERDTNILTLFLLNFFWYILTKFPQCLKITQNVALEYLNFGISHHFLSFLAASFRFSKSRQNWLFWHF